MNITIDEQIKQAIQKIAEKYDLDLAVLFGSYAKGRATKESDVDIGVYKNGGVDFDTVVRLNGDFADVFKKNIDVAVISYHTPVLMRTILTTGLVLYTKDPELMARLKLYSWKLLAESKSFRDRAFYILKQKILSSNV